MMGWRSTGRKVMRWDGRVTLDFGLELPELVDVPDA